MPYRRANRWFFRTKQPHHWTFLVALVLAVLGIAGTQTRIDVVSPHAIWFCVAAWGLLALGCLVDGL